jgi:hypothetical protein
MRALIQTTAAAAAVVTVLLLAAGGGRLRVPPPLLGRQGSGHDRPGEPGRSGVTQSFITTAAEPLGLAIGLG